MNITSNPTRQAHWPRKTDMSYVQPGPLWTLNVFAKKHLKSTFFDNEKFTKMYNKETITKEYEKYVIQNIIDVFLL
jgi:hypothetical protein